MQAVFISQCTHRAIARTVRVLDAYALRHGDRTWMTPITAEGLTTVRTQLREVATRQTAVACYVNDGRARLRLAWFVGAKGRFGPHGVVAVARTTRKLREYRPLSAGLRVASLLAKAAGLAHDLGKFGVMFQDKLNGNGPMRDVVRHEWLSLSLLLNDALDKGWQQAWARPLRRFDDLQRAADLLRGLIDARAAFLYLVFTHHRLPTDEGRSSLTDTLGDDTYFDEAALPQARIQPLSAPAPETWNRIQRAIQRLDLHEGRKELAGSEPLYWRAVATVARMALILADHSVSSIQVSRGAKEGGKRRPPAKIAYANTVVDARGRRVLNQPLDWHLQQVGEQAALFLQRMVEFDPPGLSESVLQRLRQPSDGRFAWQSACSCALRIAQAERRLPTLVFNIAGTGSGKTRMNVLCVDALRNGETVRIATGLNLRTLTLQTRDAYADQLGMPQEELACVIGSAVATRLHDARRMPAPSGQATQSVEQDRDEEDEDGNLPEALFDAVGEADPPPEWLEHFLARSPRLRPLVMSPVVVSTIDFLVRAGDPNEKANHALTMLRLMRSDLVLDEVDSYDPKALAAVMRLVTAAAMWGRHVIASSATMAEPVARALWNAFDLGIRMGRALDVLQATDWRQVLIDDRNPAQMANLVDGAAFSDWYERSLRRNIATMPRLAWRPAELLPVRPAAPGDREPLLRAIEAACVRMHGRHRWTLQVGERAHRVSFGLVRVANITPAVAVAESLCAALPSARVACYHAQMPRLQRHLLETVLDAALTRHGTVDDMRARLLHVDEVRDAIGHSINAGRDETIFVVVATPVEEVGRDHDFDWAVIEPSSAQSIVQTAGRVNRHRLTIVDTPNIGVLQFNFVKLRGSRTCFTRPGLEPADAPYASHDLADLIDWTALDEAGQIDARLKYGKQSHLLAREDDRAASVQIKNWSRRFLESPHLWMGADTYRSATLRDESRREVWTRNAEGEHFREEPVEGPRGARGFIRRNHLQYRTAPANAWLAWSLEALVDQAQRLQLTLTEGLAVEVRPAEGKRSLVFHEAFGYYLS